MKGPLTTLAILAALAASSKKQDQVAIVRVFDKMGADKKEAIRGLISLHRITPDNLADYVGDNIAAKMLIGDLVKLGCIARMEKVLGVEKVRAINCRLRQLKCPPRRRQQPGAKCGLKYHLGAAGRVVSRSAVL